jgi:hypothetical protein
MKKLLATCIIATVLAASAAVALERPATQPVRGTEGPDVRLFQNDQATQPIKGVEGPGIR